LLPALSSETPEGRRGYFQPTDATQTCLYLSAPVLSSLERFSGVASGSLERLVCSRRRACFGGTARIRSSSCSLDDAVAIFASDVSVVIPLRALRPRSHDQRGLEPPSPPPPARRDATPTSLDQRRLRSESIRAPLPFGRSRSLTEAARLESRTPWRVTPLRCADGLFSPLRARAQFWCARGVPTKIAPANAPPAA